MQTVFEMKAVTCGRQSIASGTLLFRSFNKLSQQETNYVASGSHGRLTDYQPRKLVRPQIEFDGSSQAATSTTNTPIEDIPPPWNEYIGISENDPDANEVDKEIARNRNNWIRVR
jgi:hypothetical protein